MNQFNSGPSINTYNKLSHWFDFSNPGILKVYSGKIDIGQHISSTLALIASKITEIKYDQICLLQPTSPLCEPEDILNCIYSLNSEKEFVSAVTICESSIHPFKMKRLLNNNVLVNYIDQGFEDMRPRQSLPRVYKRNGAVYLSKRSVILDEVSILGDPCLGVEVPITRSIDIDNEADFKLAEILIKEKHQI